MSADRQGCNPVHWLLTIVAASLLALIITSDAEPIPLYVVDASIETAEEAIARSMSILPEGYEPPYMTTRLARAGVMNDAMPGAVMGWDDDTLIWMVLIRTPDLVADQSIHVPVPVTDTTPVVGVAHFFDAPSGLDVAQIAITSEEQFQEYAALPHEELDVIPATIAPPPSRYE